MSFSGAKMHTYPRVRACVYKQQQQQSCINVSWLKQRTQTKGRGGPAPECDRVVVGQPGKGLPITACIFPPMHVLLTSPTLARVSSYLTFVFLFNYLCPPSTEFFVVRIRSQHYPKKLINYLISRKINVNCLRVIR